MSAKTTTVFISYASEDGTLASAIEAAFSELAADGAYPLTVIRDVHSFQFGRSLKGSIHECLHTSDILYIIYTEQLKKSHSFTGYEVGIFSEIMNEEMTSQGKCDRLIVSMYFDEPPPTETDMLGIKLDTDALEGGSTLDSSGALQRFLEALSIMMVMRQFDALHPGGIPVEEAKRLESAKDSKKAHIKDTIMPNLEVKLRGAISSVVASNFIEQRFIQLRWEAGNDSPVTGIQDDTMLIADVAGVFGVFGIGTARSKMNWREFIDALEAKDRAMTTSAQKSFAATNNAPFVVNAISNAVSSAFADGPVDNNQIFLTYERKLYRVIVTRYNVFFDGSRVMNLYLIPFLEVRDDNDIALTVQLLSILVNFRIDFLEKGAPFTADAFEAFRFNFSAFSQLVRRATRSLQVAVADSHNAGLDNPANFRKFVGTGTTITGGEIADRYSEGGVEMSEIIEVGAKFDNQEVQVTEHSALMQQWVTALNRYLKYATKSNADLSRRVLKRLEKWVETGVTD